MDQDGHGAGQAAGKLNFRNWDEHLEAAALPGRHKKSFAITIRWYLGFCRRCQTGVSFQSARDFMEWAVREKSPEPWKEEQWREAIRWFFRAGKSAEAEFDAPEEEVWVESEGLAGWELAALKTIRRGKQIVTALSNAAPECVL